MQYVGVYWRRVGHVGGSAGDGRPCRGWQKNFDGLDQSCSRIQVSPLGFPYQLCVAI